MYFAYVWRRIIIKTCIGAVLLAIVLLLTNRLLNSRTMERLLIAKIQSVGAHIGHADVQIASFQISLIPLRLIVNNVTITDQEAPFDRIALKRGVLAPYPLINQHGHLIIGHMQLDDLHVHITTNPHQAANTYEHWQLPFEVRYFSLTHAALVWQDGDQHYVFNDVDVAINQQWMHETTFDMHVHEAQTSWLTEPFELQTTGRLLGSTDIPLALEITQASIKMQHITMHSFGHLPLQYNQPLELITEAHTTIADIQHLFQHQQKYVPLEGDASLRMIWLGNFEHMHTQLHMHIDNLLWHKQLLGDIDLTASYDVQDEALINIDRFELVHPSDGRLVAHGSINQDFVSDIKLNVAMDNLHADLINRLFVRRDHAYVDLTCNGTLLLQGYLNNYLNTSLLSLDANLDITSKQYIPHAHVRTQSVIDNTSTRIDNMDIACGDSHIHIAGKIPHNPNQALHLGMDGTNVHLQEIGSIDGMPIAGNANIHAALAGSLNAPIFEAAYDIAQFQFATYHFGDTHIRMHYQHDNGIPTLSIPMLQAQYQQGHIQGSLQCSFLPTGAFVNGVVDVDKIKLSNVLAEVFAYSDIDQEIAHHMEAQLSGRMQLWGPLQQPTGLLHLRSKKLRVNNILIGPLQIEGSVGEKHHIGSLRINIQPPNGHLDAQIDIGHNKAIHTQAHLQQVPMVLFAPLLLNLHQPLQGLLSLDMDMHGLKNALSGEISLAIKQAKIGSFDLKTVAAQAHTKDGVFDIDSHFLDDHLRLHGLLSTKNHLNYKAHASFDDVHIPIQSDIDMALSGYINAHGNLDNLEHMSLQGIFTHVVIRHADINLEASKHVVMQYQQGNLVLQPVTLLHPLLRMDLHGNINRHMALHMFIDIDGKLAAISHFLPNVGTAQGLCHAKLHLAGSIDKPSLVGEADIHNARLTLRETEMGLQTIDKLNMHLVFDGRRISLQRGSAQIGGGTTTFSGETLFPYHRDAELTLRGHLKNLALQPFPDLHATLTGNLELQGSLHQLLLKGKLQADTLHYQTRLELERLIPKRNAPPLRVYATAPDRAIQLAIKIHAPNNFIISSNVFEAEMQADITLTGTTERLGILGNITPLWAQARYRDNLFKISHASIDFLDEYRIFPEFHLQANTEACKIQAEVTIQGNPDHYTITATGQDAHGLVEQQDILTCLQFGLRLSDFDGNQKAPASIGDALSGSVDTLWRVSGIDNQVKKLLPLDINEFGLTSGWSSLSQRNTTRIAVAKDLGEKLALRYSCSIDQYSDQSLSLEYRLGDKAIMQGSWQSLADVPVGDFGLDLRLHWEIR